MFKCGWNWINVRKLLPKCSLSGGRTHAGKDLRQDELPGDANSYNNKHLYIFPSECHSSRNLFVIQLLTRRHVRMTEHDGSAHQVSHTEHRHPHTLRVHLALNCLVCFEQQNWFMLDQRSWVNLVFLSSDSLLVVGQEKWMF